jgi:hypothetical protein
MNCKLVAAIGKSCKLVAAIGKSSSANHTWRVALSQKQGDDATMSPSRTHVEANGVLLLAPASTSLESKLQEDGS